MRYVKIPNLPENADTVIVSQCISAEAAEGLLKLGCTPLYAPRLPMAIEAVSDHPDCMLAHIGENRFITAPVCFEFFKEKLKDAELICGTSDIYGTYPQDAAYNIAWVGERVIHNEKCTDSVLRNIIGDRIIRVKQGYSKCSVCVVDENSIITEDRSIEKAALAAGLDVLKINSGSVKLRGLDYGFFGGCSGKIRKNILAVNGDINTHDDCEKILDFCLSRGVEIVSLAEGQLVDTGSILPITEKG